MKKIAGGVLAALFLTSCGALGDSNPTPTPTASPQKTIELFATPAPTNVNWRPYFDTKNQSNVFFGITLSGKIKVYAPFAGTVHVEGIPDPTDPTEFYLHIILVAEDKAPADAADKSVLFLYLGRAGTDVIAKVKDGDKVKVGDELAEIVGLGPSEVNMKNPKITDQIFGYWIDSSGNFVTINQKLVERFIPPRQPSR